MSVRALIIAGLLAVAAVGGILLAGSGDADSGADRVVAVPADMQEAAGGEAAAGAGDEDPAVAGGDPTPPIGAEDGATGVQEGATGAETGGVGAAGGPTGTAPARERPRAGGAAESEGAVAPSSQDPTPESILRATSRAYEGLHSFRAEFEQVLENTILGRTTRSRGTLYQRQPDRFLMEFSDPAGDLIVSDGAYFWMYFPSVDRKQVLRTQRGGQGLDLHAQFIGDPVRRFQTTYHGTEAVRGREAHVMTLEPREPMGYSRLKVWIDADDHLVRRFELTESNGNIRHFELSDLTANPSLPDELFEFTPPADAQVVTR